MQLRANLNFANYRRGNVYQLPDADYNEEQATSLVGAGYFTEVCDDRSGDADDGPVPGDDVVVSAAPKRKRKVADGQGQPEQGSEGSKGKGADDSVSGQDH